ncbi:hypothetical protein E4T39_05834 [Aureobasidium subglaciale]|nr:hypothetical protein E4T39_05834 [Aureobasidium subglaciale]
MNGALGLGGYSSSEDEDEYLTASSQHAAPAVIVESTTEPQSQSQPQTLSTPTPIHAPAPASAPLGPTLGPLAGPAAGPSPMPNPNPVADEGGEEGAFAPPSPYTTTRLMVRNLTMPPVPNFKIPPSPPGSPPPDTTTKFARFLDLKNKGTHFNERLYHSSALRNPGLLSKLMDFAGISQEDQYATPWSQSAVATKFPEWAYGDKLVAAHEKIAKKKELEKAKTPREAVDFVPAKQEAAASTSGRVERRTQGRRGLGFDNQRRRSRSPR